jgi:hypothetical protein
VSTWLVWWFVISILATAAVIAVLIALVRHVLLLGRTARRMQDEISPLADDISNGLADASSKAQGFQTPRRSTNHA